jgi:sugar phosphate isomerase/epimerase
LHDARRDGGAVRVHLPIGAGTLNIPAFLQTLADLNYAGPVVLEMNRAADLTTSQERLAAWM